MIHWSMTSEAMWPQFWSGLDPRLVSDPLAPSNSWSTFKPKRLRIACLQKRPGAHASSVSQEVFSSFKYEKRPNLVFFWGAGCGCCCTNWQWSCHVMPVSTNRNMPQPSLRGSCLGGCCLGVFVLIFFAFLILDFGYRHGCWSVDY